MGHAARFFALRLLPGDELLSALNAFLVQNDIRAGWIAGVVGSLSQASLRFAGEPDSTVLHGAFEIIALSGTLDQQGGHLHMSVSDACGQMRGGHVMPGCLVRTTCELVIGELQGLVFSREPCARSGYDELVITDSHS
ncbi:MULTISPECIES: PPC domain-containing DNA-binding protein [unclassified Paludibacterium]|uniref:PPC domain-containing DNA-binding protein n=1 Tax=unclassified Paludibacterium TaxID=2618429 RepID=UPI001C03B047|nr:PPC domain-containing DNA-binding protein [Paludibacterium sp. B53371]BEV72145.1 DNA-binding protein [Paludibacterium sp. THUN1379]